MIDMITSFHPWTLKGFSDLGHLTHTANKHEQSLAHNENAVKLKLFSKVGSIDQSLSKASAQSVQAHNAEVRRNHEILRRLIDMRSFLLYAAVYDFIRFL